MGLPCGLARDVWLFTVWPRDQRTGCQRYSDACALSSSEQIQCLHSDEWSFKAAWTLSWLSLYKAHQFSQVYTTYTSPFQRILSTTTVSSMVEARATGAGAICPSFLGEWLSWEDRITGSSGMNRATVKTGTFVQNCKPRELKNTQMRQICEETCRRTVWAAENCFKQFFSPHQKLCGWMIWKKDGGQHC